MKKIGVYILEGPRLYVGSTEDLDRRLFEHIRGHTHTTKRIKKWELRKFFPCSSIEHARILEKKIKRSKNTRRWLDYKVDERLDILMGCIGSVAQPGRAVAS